MATDNGISALDARPTHGGSWRSCCRTAFHDRRREPRAESDHGGLEARVGPMCERSVASRASDSSIVPAIAPSLRETRRDPLLLLTCEFGSLIPGNRAGVGAARLPVFRKLLQSGDQIWVERVHEVFIKLPV